MCQAIISPRHIAAGKRDNSLKINIMTLNLPADRGLFRISMRPKRPDAAGPHLQPGAAVRQAPRMTPHTDSQPSPHLYPARQPAQATKNGPDLPEAMPGSVPEAVSEAKSDTAPLPPGGIPARRDRLLRRRFASPAAPIISGRPNKRPVFAFDNKITNFAN